MLEGIVAVVVLGLITTGVLVMVGPRKVTSTIRSLRRRVRAPIVAPPQASTAPRSINPKTQRVLTAAAKLSNWLRAHGQEEAAREIRTSAARIATNEPAGLYALQTSMRRVRVVNITDTISQERLRTLVAELQSAVKDRFEQLELLPFRRP